MSRTLTKKNCLSRVLQYNKIQSSSQTQANNARGIPEPEAAQDEEVPVACYSADDNARTRGGALSRMVLCPCLGRRKWAHLIDCRLSLSDTFRLVANSTVPDRRANLWQGGYLRRSSFCPVCGCRGDMQPVSGTLHASVKWGRQDAGLFAPGITDACRVLVDKIKLPCTD